MNENVFYAINEKVPVSLNCFSVRVFLYLFLIASKSVRQSKVIISNFMDKGISL